MRQPSKKSNKLGSVYDKTTKSGQRMLTIYLEADRVKDLLETAVNEKGQIKLSGLENTYKEKDSQPDFNIVEPIASGSVAGAHAKGNARPVQGAGNAGTKRSNFPY